MHRFGWTLDEFLAVRRDALRAISAGITESCERAEAARDAASEGKPGLKRVRHEKAHPSFVERMHRKWGRMTEKVRKAMKNRASKTPKYEDAHPAFIHRMEQKYGRIPDGARRIKR